MCPNLWGIWKFSYEQYFMRPAFVDSGKLSLKRFCISCVHWYGKFSSQRQQLADEGHYGLVVDGASLQILLDNMKDQFYHLCRKCTAVVCCRMSPKQKAEVWFVIGIPSLLLYTLFPSFIMLILLAYCLTLCPLFILRFLSYLVRHGTDVVCIHFLVWLWLGLYSFSLIIILGLYSFSLIIVF